MACVEIQLFNIKRSLTFKIINIPYCEFGRGQIFKWY